MKKLKNNKAARTEVPAELIKYGREGVTINLQEIINLLEIWYGNFVHYLMNGLRV